MVNTLQHPGATSATSDTPEPVRGDEGAPILGPRNKPLERENPD